MATVKSGRDGRGGDLAVSAAIGHTPRIRDRLLREPDLGDLAPLRLAVGVLGKLRQHDHAVRQLERRNAAG